MKSKKKSNKFEPPKADSGDTAHLVTKAALSFVPAASELFEYFVKPPLERRLDEWRKEISQFLYSLEKVQEINLEALQENEQFISVVAQASAIAIRNHQKEKLIALRNAIANSATGSNLNDDLQLTFIRFIEELTPSHLQVLRFFMSHEEEVSSLKSYPAIYQLLSETVEELPSRDQFKMFIGDLASRGLIWISPDIDDFENIYQASSLLTHQTNDDLPRIIITDIAKGFLKFISESK